MYIIYLWELLNNYYKEILKDSRINLLSFKNIENLKYKTKIFISYWNDVSFLYKT